MGELKTLLHNMRGYRTSMIFFSLSFLHITRNFHMFFPLDFVAEFPIDVSIVKKLRNGYKTVGNIQVVFIDSFK